MNTMIRSRWPEKVQAETLTTLWQKIQECNTNEKTLRGY